MMQNINPNENDFGRISADEIRRHIDELIIGDLIKLAIQLKSQHIYSVKSKRGNRKHKQRRK